MMPSLTGADAVRSLVEGKSVPRPVPNKDTESRIPGGLCDKQQRGTAAITL
jgi:hypothetical protein